MQKLGTTGDYPYVGGYLAKISSGTGHTSAWAELRVGYTIIVPLKPTLWSMKVAGADIAIRNGEILQVPAMDERQTLKQPHEPGYLVVLQYGDPGLMLPSVIHAEVFAPCFTKIVSPQTHRQPFEPPPPAHTNTSPSPPPPTLALGLTPHTSTSSPFFLITRTTYIAWCSPAYPFSYTTHKLRPARFL